MSLRIYGNRPLKTLPGLATRPTPSRVRQALFNIWQGKITGCRWLDLCAGSGAMGAEALCRGAAIVMGIEESGRACNIIQQNWQQVAQPEQRFEVIRGDVVSKVLTLAQRSPKFDRIYFDPPYASDLYLPVLEAIADHSLLAGELAAEHSPTQPLPEHVGNLAIVRQKVYGSTALTFYSPQNSDSPLLYSNRQGG
ncbi:MAG: 16S rRNA (guanine(966)-N(2))-methyltransferase RsmD [Drouetiella hepatica Uher 2000/2452]|jgi:16S rRNA (guanine(966)-N(2))-methyltransferase RsmD|uniref:16S rRNA (Guanine(966)-N(2))-methyltransferase RsmD n=1 Tax=Drouetiella hepatica Uher 2000/2452 TaxID=904376 RepID=A0A951Q8L6_9CYAN|nr:16S rRNA (guanine(966)-N(2))-methyltransferase RsmD [Drouetiella hepatica Uher 2000/2452]